MPRRFAFIATLLALVAGTYAAATAQTMPAVAGGGSERVLHAFTGAPDGAIPFAGAPVLEPSGSTWRERVLHVFEDDATDGGMPTSAVVRDGEGHLYGTTSYGGPAGPYAGGTVFRLMVPAPSSS